MAQFNDNFISFVGTGGQMRQILLAMARNHLAAVPKLRGQGFDWLESEPEGADRLADMEIPELAEFLGQQAVDAIALLNPESENACTSDGYEFDRPRKVRGTDLWELDMDFCSAEGTPYPPLADLGAFGFLLPSGTYSFGGVFRYEGDGNFYFDLGEFQCDPEDADDYDEDEHFWYQDESVWPSRREEVLEALRQIAAGDSALSYVAVSLAHAVGDWLSLPEFSALSHAEPAAGGEALERNVLRLLGEFPVHLGVRLMESPAGTWEGMRPGTPLVVSSAWKEGGDLSLEVQDAQGSSLEPVYRVGDLRKLPYDDPRNELLADTIEAVAFVLPHLTARFGGANPDTAFVRLEFAGGIDVEGLLAGVRAAAAEPPEKRTLSTGEGR